jgi:hypothetical protein
MNDDSEKKLAELNIVPGTQKKPDDSGTIAVNAHFKIFDPNTKEVYVEDRG